MVPRRSHSVRSACRCPTPVAAIGDAAASFDPISGRGAQNAVIQSVLLIRALREHTGKITYEWLQDQFNLHREHRAEAATEVPRLFLGDEKPATLLWEATEPARDVIRIGPAYALTDRVDSCLHLLGSKRASRHGTPPPARGRFVDNGESMPVRRPAKIRKGAIDWKRRDKRHRSRPDLVGEM